MRFESHLRHEAAHIPRWANWHSHLSVKQARKHCRFESYPRSLSEDVPPSTCLTGGLFCGRFDTHIASDREVIISPRKKVPAPASPSEEPEVEPYTGPRPGDYVRVLRAQIDKPRWRKVVGVVRAINEKNRTGLVLTPLSDPFDITVNLEDIEGITFEEYEGYQIPMKSDQAAPTRKRRRVKKK